MKTNTPTTPLWEPALIATICFGWFILISIRAAAIGYATGGFSDASLVQSSVFELSLAFLALAILHRRNYVLKDLIPWPSWRGTSFGIVLYAVTIVAMALVVIPFLSGQRQPIDEILANSRPSLPMVLVSASINATYEEVFLLGYLFRRLEPYGASFAMSFALLVRILYHVYQGPIGTLAIFVFGLVLSLFYFRQRQLWPLVVAHILADTIPFVMQ